jgi:hypothetical protein
LRKTADPTCRHANTDLYSLSVRLASLAVLVRPPQASLRATPAPPPSLARPPGATSRLARRTDHPPQRSLNGSVPQTGPRDSDGCRRTSTDGPAAGHASCNAGRRGRNLASGRRGHSLLPAVAWSAETISAARSSVTAIRRWRHNVGPSDRF